MPTEEHSSCQRRKTQSRSKAPLQKYLVGAPGERISTDITGPFLETEGGNKYIVCFGDLFTKFVVAVPIKDMTAVTVSDALLNHWIFYFVVPKELHSDKGSQYESDISTETM